MNFTNKLTFMNIRLDTYVVCFPNKIHRKDWSIRESRIVNYSQRFGW